MSGRLDPRLHHLGQVLAQSLIAPQPDQILDLATGLAVLFRREPVGPASLGGDVFQPAPRGDQRLAQLVVGGPEGRLRTSRRFRMPSQIPLPSAQAKASQPGIHLSQSSHPVEDAAIEVMR